MNKVDILGRTPLHHAAQHDALDAVRLFLAHGADPFAKDWKERTPLELADSGYNRAMASLIRKEISLRGSQRAKGLKVLMKHDHNQA